MNEALGLSPLDGVPGPSQDSPMAERFRFTRMESIVAEALADGLTYKEIAKSLAISYHTVHTHVKAIHEKAGVGNNGRLLALIHGK